jgi:DNA polymerase-3 subunit alpha
MELILLDLAPPPAGGPPVVITLRSDKITAELVAELKHILQAHPGRTRVIVKMEAPGKSPRLLDLHDFPVEPTSSFMADIKSLLGAAALAPS